MNREQFTFRGAEPVDLTTLQIPGQRLALRAIEESDSTAIFPVFTAEVTRYMFPKPAERIEETLAFITGSRLGMVAGCDLVLAITLAATGEFLGCCGFHGEGKPHTPELGIWLKQTAHGHGYGREAIWLLAAWAVDHVNFDYLIYPVDRANVASRKIPESLGGVVVAEKQVTALSGTILDEVIYHISHEQLRRCLELNNPALNNPALK